MYVKLLCTEMINRVTLLYCVLHTTTILFEHNQREQFQENLALTLLKMRQDSCRDCCVIRKDCF